MALKHRIGLLVSIWIIGARVASAQSATTELDVTVGHSTDQVQAASSQVRIFGDVVADWRYYLEGTWAQTWGPTSDAFGSAYPYDKRIHPMEMYGERTSQFGAYLAGVRLGRYRTPFGLYNRSDHAYNGFLRAPLIRYGGYWALSNNFLEGGASVMAGVPKLFAEASLGVPQDEDTNARRNGLDEVVRVQGTVGPVIVGASHIRTRPSEARTFARGRAEFTGVDVRWMYSGVQLRGEWIDGRPFDGTRTFGGYIDALVHHRLMGPVTAVLRAERLDYFAGRASSFPRRFVAGGRIRLTNSLVGQINVLDEYGYRGRTRNSALDVGLTFSKRR
jgi:hypothetical protein